MVTCVKGALKKCKFKQGFQVNRFHKVHMCSIKGKNAPVIVYTILLKRENRHKTILTWRNVPLFN